MEVSPEKSLVKAQKYCAYQERSQQEVRDKLYSWGLHRKEVEHIISELINSNFLKEERFASAFAGGKFRMKKWGKNKIRMALEQKKVSEPLIKKALKEIPDPEYVKTLKNVLKKQMDKIEEENLFKRKYKMASFAMRRGFEPDLVWSVLNDMFGEE